MSNAWEVTNEDVMDVLSSNLILNGDQVVGDPDLQRLADKILPTLDIQSIEDAALQGDDVDQQRDFANDEITNQLVRAGAIIRMPHSVPINADVHIVLGLSKATPKLGQLAVADPSLPLTEALRQKLNWREVLTVAANAVTIEESVSAAHREIRRQLEAQGYVEGPAEDDAPVELNKFQQAVLAVYACGDFAHLLEPMSQRAFQAEMDGCGDGLLRFLITELSTSEDCTTEEEALSRLAVAVNDITALSSSVENADQLLASIAERSALERSGQRGG